MMRGLRPDRNPLRRWTDKAEAALVAVLLAAFLAGAPAAMLTAGHWAYAAGLHTQQAERTDWRQVPAVLLQDAPQRIDTADGAVALPVPAQWTAPNGLTRIGMVFADGPAGATVTIWINAHGQPVGSPLSPGQVTCRAALSAVGAGIGLAVVLLIAWALSRGALHRRRLAAWESEWQVTGPRWTSRR
jgi:hypothetical protein